MNHFMSTLLRILRRHDKLDFIQIAVSRHMIGNDQVTHMDGVERTKIQSNFSSRMIFNLAHGSVYNGVLSTCDFAISIASWHASCRLSLTKMRSK